MKVLITGNMGYVGPSVVAHFREAFADVYLAGVDQAFFAHCLTGAGVLPEHALNVQHFADVRELDDEIVAGMDVIVHLAAVSNDPMGNEYKQVTGEINHHASVRLAVQAKRLGVSHFVFASSCSVYGYAEGNARDEDSPLNPLTEYARSKINTERDLAPLADGNFVVTCLRFPTACGMSDRLRLDLVLNDFVACALASGRIQVLSDGTPWRPLIDVQDMARAMAWAAERPQSQGGAFLAVNAGRTEWNYQIVQLAQAVSDAVGGTRVDINEQAPPDKRSYRVDFSRYQALAPEHSPRVALKQSIAGLKHGLESIGFDDENFRESHLIRLHMLARLRAAGKLDDVLRWRT